MIFGVAKEDVASFMEKRAPQFPDEVTSDPPEVFDRWTSLPFS
jgi:hypothetical protein